LAIELDGVSKRYRVYRERYRSLKEVLMHHRFGEWEERWALREVSLQVERGSTLGLIGHNGAGKSTTLKLIARILVPDRGRIQVSGRAAGLLELGAGFQPEYTGRENIHLNASLMGLTRREIDARFDDIVSFSELDDVIDTPLRTYSSGMQMRLGFAVAVHSRPEVLVVDEVLAVGDAAFQRKCMDWIETFQGAGGTIAMVSHNLGVVREVCDVVAWMERGRIVRMGEAEGVVDAYIEKVREETGLASGETIDSPGGPHHDIEIGSVRLIDRQGQEVSQIGAGEPLVVEVPYRVYKAMATPVLGVAIHRNDGAYIYGTNTHVDGQELGPLDKDGLVRLCYPSLNLLGGTYLVSVLLFADSRTTVAPIDARWQQYRLRVEANGEDSGLVRLDHRWELSPSLEGRRS